MDETRADDASAPPDNARREFLQGVRRWSSAVATLALGGAFVVGSAPTASAWVNGAAWVNTRGGWINGAAWVNRSVGWINGAGGWVNRSGGGTAGWVNRAGGGGAGWVNHRGGGGAAWVNR